MARCFSLTRNGETEPTPLVQIDEELCAAFKTPVHPEKFLMGWVDSVGLRLALGDDWATIAREFEECWPAGLDLIKYLAPRFQPNCWRG